MASIDGEFRIARLRTSDAGEAWTVQRAAYVREAQLHDAPMIPPLLETLDQLRAEIDDPAVHTFGAWLGHRLVGSVRGRVAGSRMEVARYTVAPDLQGQGIGRALLRAVEAAAPDTVAVLWLTAGGQSHDNHRRYARAGYRQVAEDVDPAGIGIIRMEKPNPRSAAERSAAAKSMDPRPTS